MTKIAVSALRRHSFCHVAADWVAALILLLGLPAAAGGDSVVVTFGESASSIPTQGVLTPAFETCEVPPLLFGAAERSFLSPAQFASFANLVLGTTEPGTCSDNMRRETAFRSDAELLSDQVHLARERGIESEACDGANWRIVAIVIDDCGELAAPAEKVGSCAPEVRIVAQPFTHRQRGLVSRDDSMHLIYSVARSAAFTRDRTVLLALLATSASNCDLPRLNEVLVQVRRYAAPEKLVRIAWSTSSRSGQHWSFGSLVRDGEGWRLDKLPTGGTFDNFSKTEMLRGTCSINREHGRLLRAAFRCSEKDGPDRQPQAEIARLQDPTRSRRSEGLCVGCHMADQLALLGAHRGPILDQHGLSLFARAGVALGNQRQIGYRYDGRFWISHRMRLILTPKSKDAPR